MVCMSYILFNFTKMMRHATLTKRTCNTWIIALLKQYVKGAPKKKHIYNRM